MVAEHLPVVLPTGLGVDNQDLMQVKCDLEQVIEFDGPRKRDVGVASPYIDRMEDRSGQL